MDSDSRYFVRFSVSVLLTVALLTAGLSALAQSPTGSEPAPLFSHVAPGRLALIAGAVLLLIMLHGFLATAEIALITIRSTRLQQLVEEGNRSAVLVRQMLAQPTRLMATIQTGMMLVAMFAAAIAAVSIVPPVTDWLRENGSGVLVRYALLFALTLVMVPVVLLLLVLGGIAPKSLATLHSERLALFSVRPVRWLQVLLSPPVAVVTLLSNIVLKPFGGTAHFTTPAFNEEELKLMVEASEEQGVLEADETEMIHSILTFGDTVVRKVMTPRIDMTGVPVEMSRSELIRRVLASGHSRIPVFEEDMDNIVGIVHAKDLLALPFEKPEEAVSLRDVMRPPYFIPETKRIGELLTELRRTRQHLAIVRDEYGITAGVVSLEDLLEEIVGEIQDEYDDDEPMVQVLDSHTTLLDGRMALADVNERMGFHLPEEEADTIGGFVFGLLGHQAEAGECACWEGVDFCVEATDGRRITKVRIVREERHEPPGEPSAGDMAGEQSDRENDQEEYRGRSLEVSGVETAPSLMFRR